MEKICIGIKTLDYYYGQVLQDVLQRNYRGFTVNVEVLEENNMNKETAKDGDETFEDLWLTDNPNIVRSGEVLLVDNPGSEDLQGAKGYYQVFRYTSAKELIIKLLDIISSKRDIPVFYNHSEKGKIITCCASKGGAGVTSMCLALAQELTRYRNKQVFYLSLEQFPSCIYYMDTSGNGKSMRSFFLEWVDRNNCIRPINNSNTNGFDGRWEKVVVEDIFGIKTFAYDGFANSILELCDEDFQELLKYIIIELDIDYLIIDCGQWANNVVVSSLRASDEIFFLTGDKYRDKMYLKNVENHTKALLSQSVHLVKNMYIETKADGEYELSRNQQIEEFVEDKDELYFDDREREFNIDYDEEAFLYRKNMLDISLATSYGKCIKEIARFID